MKNEIIEYFKEKNIEIDENLLNYLEGGVDITKKDEYKHDFKAYPPHHNESWYFNLIDTLNNLFIITRISFEMGQKKSRIMLILLLNGKITGYARDYFNIEQMSDTLDFDKKVKYYCIEPMKKWRITYQDRKIDLDVTLKGRFQVYNYLSHNDPLTSIKNLGVDLLERTAQHHYEQGMKATGTLILKKKGKKIKIDCLGHRDHSWGTRDWVKIDRWNWISAQFEDETINIFKIQFADKYLINGFCSTKEGNISINSVEISTETKEDGKTPKSSKFLITDEKGRKRTIESETIQSIYLPLPSSEGFAEIFEQIVRFKVDGKNGAGVAEYLLSNTK
ncbi:MAG: DUF7064 domain-containing protein [Candidatus Helarchaeota archaeon]